MSTRPLLIPQMKDNGFAGIHLLSSHNFTFEATIGSDETEGEGYVGSLDGQQPIDIIIETTSLVTFTDLRVRSANGELLDIPALFSLRRIFLVSSSVSLLSHTE